MQKHVMFVATEAVDIYQDMFGLFHYFTQMVIEAVWKQVEAIKLN